jgi:hypothetical protein
VIRAAMFTVEPKMSFPSNDQNLWMSLGEAA